MNNKKNILMIALDFPPCQSAGVQRTLKFAEYLTTLGWQPIILTVNEDVHRVIDEEIVIPKNIKVYRCHSFDSSRDFSFKGKYFAWSKIPDKWWTWAFKAIPLGKLLIDKYQPSLIWSTYPVSTAHYIAYKLQKHSNLPWIADYRDPLQCRYDINATQYSFISKWIEQKAIENSTKAIFTTQRAAKLYQRLYPDELLSKFNVIENGYDESNFLNLPIKYKVDGNKFLLLHSGSIYKNGRDPYDLFVALSSLKKKNIIDRNNFSLVLRGASNNIEYANHMKKLNIDDLIIFKKTISYKESLQEMMMADCLLIIQGTLFNNQIPSKAYEYIRVGKPIIALTAEGGATDELMAKVEMAHCAHNCNLIEKILLKILAGPNSENVNITQYSRQEKTKQLLKIINNACF